jgi:glycine betaine/proline transport system substrate-binding protein
LVAAPKTFPKTLIIDYKRLIMQIKTLLRPVFIGGTLMSLLFVFAACASTAPEPQVVEREVTKEVRVEVTKEVPVEVTKEVPVEVTKEVRVEVEKEVIKEVMMSPPAMAMPGEGVTVRPGRANWNTGYFHEALYSLALEQLGYDVQEHQELDNAIFYQSLANGDLDFWANGWFPLHDQFEDTWSQGAEIAGTVIKGGGMQGYLVDKASVEEFGIMTLADFAKPEIKAAFDHDGDGKADLYGCSDGWGCNKVIEYQIEAFELSDHINHNTGQYDAMFAEVKARHANGESVLYYASTPGITLTEGFGLVPGSDVTWIEVPSFAHPVIKHEWMVKIYGVEGCVRYHNPCFLGFAANDIQIVANSKFLAGNPAAKRLFEVMNLSLGDVLAQNNRMEAGENSQEDIDNHAKEWAAINEQVWNNWLNQARSAVQ